MLFLGRKIPPALRAPIAVVHSVGVLFSINNTTFFNVAVNTVSFISIVMTLSLVHDAGSYRMKVIQLGPNEGGE